MIKKHAFILTLIISLVLLLIAIRVYPGGTYENRYTVGFNWERNYFSNLFEAVALNGKQNISRYWAFCGMFFYSLSTGIFFVDMSKKIPNIIAGKMLRYTGLINMVLTYLTVTALHDLMLTLSNIVFWSCIVFILAFLIKARLFLLSIYCILCLMIFFVAVAIHISNNWALLPLAQKVNSISTLGLLLLLEFLTKKEDFDQAGTKVV